MCLFMQTLSGKKVISLELKAKMNELWENWIFRKPGVNRQPSPGLTILVAMFLLQLCFPVCLYVYVFIFGGGLGQIGQRGKYLCSRTWFLSIFPTLTLGLLPSPRFQEYQIGESFKNFFVSLLSSLICLNVTSFIFAFLFYLRSIPKIEKYI